MRKYSEVNVLKIKQDIEIAQRALADVTAKKEAEQREYETAKQNRIAEQQKVSSIWDDAAKHIQVATTAKNNLQTDIDALRVDKVVLKVQVASWRQMLSEVVERLSKANEPVKDHFITALIDKTRQTLGSLVSKRKEEERLLETVRAERESLENGNSLLKDQELAFTGKVSALDAELAHKRAEVAELEKNREDILKREEDVSAMEVRISPEFQKLYGAFKDKKKDRGI